MNYHRANHLLEEVRHALRTEAGQKHPGERCPQGQHWNDDEGKCMELPPDLHAMVVGANKKSQYAGHPWDKGPFSAKQQAQHHDVAAEAHHRAWKNARFQGFTPLGVKHRKIRDAHRKRADALRTTSTRGR